MAQKSETKVKETSTKTKSKAIEWAVVNIAGKQLMVENGGEYTIDKLSEEKGKKLVSEEVLLIVQDGKATIGKPFIKGAKVEYEVVSQKKDKKLKVFKFKAKARYRKTIGHRSHLTRISVKKISA